MSKNQKYSSLIEQQGATWLVKIQRQVTSSKTIISKEQSGFSTESDAQEWADSQLAEFTSKQVDRNKRHGSQRKSSSDERVQRSARRAEKTKLSKELAKKNEAEIEASVDDESELSEE